MLGEGDGGRTASPASTAGCRSNERRHGRPRSQSAGRRFAVDTSRAKSHSLVVSRCIQRLGWQEFAEGRPDNKPCDIYWLNVVSSDIREMTVPGSKVNKFPGMKELSKKISLTRAIASMRRLFPQHFDFYPKSWFVPAQLATFRQHCDELSRLNNNNHHANQQWFIAKPDEGAQGGGIYLLRNSDQIQNAEEPQLIQEYISDPYLLPNNFKFDLRVYAVIRNLNPLRIYVSREGMARFCTQEYRQPTEHNQDMAFMHLTNYSLNKTSTDYVHSNSLNEEGSKRLLSSVFLQMAARGVNTRKIWRNIKAIIVKTVLAMVPELILYYENHFSAPRQGPQCFQIMGFDVLIQQDLQPILLEVNASPSLTVGHESAAAPTDPADPADTAAVEQQQAEAATATQAVVSIVDEAIKVPLVRDTLLLVAGCFDSKSRVGSACAPSVTSEDGGGGGNLVALDELASISSGVPTQRADVCLREVFPSRFTQLGTTMLVMNRAAYLYMQFISVRRSLLISAAGFRTFVRKCNLADLVSPPEVDLLYAEILQSFEGTDGLGVPFHGFVGFMSLLAERRTPAAAADAPLLEAFVALLRHCEARLRYHGIRSARLRPGVVVGRRLNSHNRALDDIYLLPERAPGAPLGRRPRLRVAVAVAAAKRSSSERRAAASLPRISAK